jgi:hypothetical protein
VADGVAGWRRRPRRPQPAKTTAPNPKCSSPRDPVELHPVGSRRLFFFRQDKSHRRSWRSRDLLLSPLNASWISPSSSSARMFWLRAALALLVQSAKNQKPLFKAADTDFPSPRSPPFSLPEPALPISTYKLPIPTPQVRSTNTLPAI